MTAGTAIAANGASHHPDDAALLAAATRHSQSAFAAIVERHFQIVYRVVWRLTSGHADAEDITQEAFLRLWKDPAQVREAAALRGWLVRVASNLAMDRFRRPLHRDLDDAGEISDGRPDAETSMERRQLSRTIDGAVAELPERQRLALTLVHFEHMTNIDAARVMEISVDALESLLARARRSLKERLQPRKTELLAALAAEGA